MGREKKLMESLYKLRTNKMQAMSLNDKKELRFNLYGRCFLVFC